MQFITHNGKKIIYLDLRGLSEAQILQNIERFCDLLLRLAESGNRDMRYLANFQGGYVSPDVTNAVIEAAKTIHPYVLRGAIVADVNITKRILMQTYNALTGGNRKLFNSEDEAKEWLAAD